MEVTLLIEAMDTSFGLLEDARKKAVDLLDTAVKLTSETRGVEEKKIQTILKGAQETKLEFLNVIATFVILFGFWVLLSGKYDFFHLTLGVICSLLVAFLTHDLLFSNARVGDAKVIFRRFIAYITRLLYQILS